MIIIFLSLSFAFSLIVSEEQMPITGLSIKPHQLTPLLATPRALALVFAGAATYIGFIDPKVRNELEGTKNKL